MNSRAHLGNIAVTRILTLFLSFSAMWQAVPPGQAAALHVPSGLTIVRDDRNAIIQWDFDPENPVQPLPNGVVGYKITWGPASQPDTSSKLTEERILQLQPLDNNKPYVVRVQSVDSAGHLSAASASISFNGGDPARVDGLRTSMNGFFDDFNRPAGAPDELKWNSAYSQCNADTSNGFFINDQFHAHNTVYSGNCDRGQSISRPRATLDFTDNGTRTIVFDWDGEFRRNRWYLDLVPRMMDISGQVNIEGTVLPADPAHGIRFHQNEQSADIFEFGNSGAEITRAQTNFDPFPPLDYAGVKQVSNVRRRWEIHISRHNAEVLIDGKLVMKTDPNAFNLTEDHYTVLWNVFSYNTNKANVPFVLAHWDNFGFDAPAGTTHTTETHNYRLVNVGSDFMKTFGDNAQTQATLNIPDTVDGATARRLMFSLQADGGDTYSWSASDRVLVNGSAFAIPMPVSNAQPTLSPADLVNAYSPYTTIIALPPGVLKQGANQISFDTRSSSVLNIHAELDFNAASAPAYTQPAQAIGGALTPAIPAVGPNALITKIGTKAVDPFTDNMDSAAVFNPTVSGIVPLEVEAHNDISLQATGSNIGVKQIEVLIDNQVVLSQRTDAEVAAPGIITTLNLDTRGLSNGTHEIFFRAYNPRCTPNIADYQEAGGQSGKYFPLHINVQNKTVAVAAAPSLSFHTMLPLIIKGPQPTCVIALAQTAASQPAGNRSTFFMSTPDAVRDEQRVMICDV